MPDDRMLLVLDVHVDVRTRDRGERGRLRPIERGIQRLRCRFMRALPHFGHLNLRLLWYIPFCSLIATRHFGQVTACGLPA